MSETMAQRILPHSIRKGIVPSIILKHGIKLQLVVLCVCDVFVVEGLFQRKSSKNSHLIASMKILIDCNCGVMLTSNRRIKESNGLEGRLFDFDSLHVKFGSGYGWIYCTKAICQKQHITATIPFANPCSLSPFNC